MPNVTTCSSAPLTIILRNACIGPVKQLVAASCSGIGGGGKAGGSAGGAGGE